MTITGLPKSCHIIPPHRSGVNFTLSAVEGAVDELKRELCAIDDDKEFFARTADVTLMHTLEAIKNQADRISSVCDAEIRNLKARLKRHARVA
jgi:hypothetical protein